MRNYIIGAGVLLLAVVVFPNLNVPDQAEADAAINWKHDLEKAKKAAVEEQKLIFMDIYADWCGPCRRMDAQTFKDEAVVNKLTTKFVPVKVDADTKRAMAEKYGTGYLPTLVVLSADGQIVARVAGFLPPSEFIAFLEEAEKQYKDKLKTENI